MMLALSLLLLDARLHGLGRGRHLLFGGGARLVLLLILVAIVVLILLARSWRGRT